MKIPDIYIYRYYLPIRLCIFVHQHIVVSKRSTKEHRSNIFKTVDPLLSLTLLSTNINHSVMVTFKRERGEGEERRRGESVGI